MSDMRLVVAGAGGRMGRTLIHAIAASEGATLTGAVEAAVTLLSLQHQFLPPNINIREVDPALKLNIVVNEARPGTFDMALSNSFGFGGTNASIILTKPRS